jgi:hypothetical protein
MAKALFGHIAAAPDPRLIAELTYLRSRVRTLEDEVSQLRDERDARIAQGLEPAGFDHDLRELSQISVEAAPALA